MKILMIGGTGVISGDITRQLAQAGHDVWVLNRGTHSAQLPEGAHSLVGDIHDEAAVQKLVAGHTFDAVADFVAYVPAHVERDVRLFRGITGQYVFISSASAYQKPLSSPLITESTPLANPYWQYSRDKIACEDVLVGHYRQSGFPITIVRPSHTYSAPNVPLAVHGAAGSWPVLRRMLDGKPVVVHGDGSSLWTLTHARDFAKGFIGLLANPHAIGEAVHITGDESLTWNQIYAILGRALGVEPNLVYAPSTLLAAAGKPYGYDFEGALLGDKANTVLFDNTKLKRLVPGFAATTRFDTGVRESIAALLADESLQPADPDFDRFCDSVAAAMRGALASF